MLNELSYRTEIAKVSTRLSGLRLIFGLRYALLPLWTQDTLATHGPTEFTLVKLREHGSRQYYLFDTTRLRAVAAFGIPVYVSDDRDSSRENNFPQRPERALVNGRDVPRFAKGHLIAHSLGGGMDINFVPQLARMNGGQFKVLENRAKRLAKDSVQAFYFVRCVYSQTSAPENLDVPSMLQQCVVEPLGTVHYREFQNVDAPLATRTS